MQQNDTQRKQTEESKYKTNSLILIKQQQSATISFLIHCYFYQREGIFEFMYKTNKTHKTKIDENKMKWDKEIDSTKKQSIMIMINI